MSAAAPLVTSETKAVPAPKFLDFLNTDPYADGVNTIKDPNERVNIDKIVNPSMLHAHLALMTRFKAIEQLDEKVDLRYILRAQKRYLIWMRLLQQREFAEGSLPIPPIDVCYIWHVHALSPLRYFEDMSRLHDLAELNYNFPLAVLHKTWEKHGDHVDDYSEKFWQKHTRLPWVLDPKDDSDFSLTCIDCNKILKIHWLEYVNIYRTPEYKKTCPHCTAELSSESLSAKRFLKDIRLFLRNRKNYIGGSLLDSQSGNLSRAAAQLDCSVLFRRSSAHIARLIDNSMPRSKVCKWAYIIEKIRQRLTELDRSNEIGYIREGVAQRIVIAYMNNPAPFSFDLVSAALRQRNFTHKMVANKWINHVAIQTQAITRYHKFLLLKSEQRDMCLVPTLDIDLAWHTHIIHSRHYREYTSENVNRIIDHNDTLSRSTLSDGFAVTSRAWYKRYHEPYTQEDPYEYWLTTRRKVMAALIPPYAIWVSYRLKKYRKGTGKREHQEHTYEDSWHDCDCEKGSPNKTTTVVENAIDYASSCGISGNSMCGAK